MEEIVELQVQDYFKNGEQICIQIDDSQNEYAGVMHKHAFIEIAFVLSGTARHCIGDAVYEVKKGDLVIVNYGVPHAFTPIRENEEIFSTYDLLFTPELFDITGIGNDDFSSLASSYLFYSLFADSAIGENALNLIRSGTDEIGCLFDKMYREYTERAGGFMNMLRAYLIELITLIFREIDRQNRSRITKEQREVVNKAIEYMRQNYNTKIRLENIVSDIFLSKNYFRQLFKTTTGTSITDFIQKTRIEEACRLLTTTDRTVFDIAGDCGFNDMKFFYKTFKKITGKRPGDYRKK